MYDINTIEELIEALGGDTELAKQIGISSSGVGMWKVRQEIAAGWHMRLFAELCKIGKTVNPSVFGMTEEEFAPLARSSAIDARIVSRAGRRGHSQPKASAAR